MNIENKSGITPVGLSVLVLPDQVEEKSTGGIIVATTTELDRFQMAQTDAQVIAIGPLAWHDEPSPRCKVGDRVIIAKYTGMVRQGNDDLKYRLVLDSDIVALLEKE